MVKNIPDYAWGRKWWVVRVVEGARWFYGAYDSEVRAWEVACEVGGEVEYNREAP